MEFNEKVQLFRDNHAILGKIPILAKLVVAVGILLGKIVTVFSRKEGFSEEVQKVDTTALDNLNEQPDSDSSKASHTFTKKSESDLGKIPSPFTNSPVHIKEDVEPLPKKSSEVNPANTGIKCGSEKVAFDFVPTSYISSVKNRMDVKALPKEKIKELMKGADVFEQEVILQDLLIAGRTMATKEERDLIALAAELYVTSSEDTQRDFLFHLVGVKSIFKIFSSAMSANVVFHEFSESNEKGSSGLTIEQLKMERALAEKLFALN